MSDSSRAVFLSYASQDAQAARRICDALREAGLEVWFDQSELRGGDAWDASIRTQIRECALFVPIVSANSNARSEGYFRREWNLAVTRMLDMSDDHAFLVPVVIDETTQESARVPDRFRERQWSRLPGGEPPKSFVDRVKRLLAGTVELPPRRGPAGARSDNLPLPLDSFIGRGREVRELEGLLATAPLVTLTGAGGTGKTRLSLRVAAGLVDRFPDGVWLVELAPIADARLVPQAIASALGVKEAGGRPIAEALANHVRPRSLLLVLDNCEHLSASCAEIAKALLSASPNLKILATSREPMRVRGETTYPVLPLPAPEWREAIDADAILRSDAVRLFVDRAIAAQPAFAVTDGNAAVVAEICRHLDGLPLAIELAAARVRALSVETIAGRLGERFHLLASGDPTALPRQQTLRALIDWSHDLLTQPERMLLRRLAVFAGSWTVDAAESVASGSGIDKPDVLDLMTSLVEKSLVTHEAKGTRYRLLETIREYALERLAEAGEADATRTRHLAHYLALAERANPELVGPDQGMWLARLDAERENFLAAHAWCDPAEAGPGAGLRLVRALRRYWISRGLPGLAHRLVVEALARPGAEERSLARCRALFDAGQLDSCMGRYAEAMGYLSESLAIAREIGDAGRIEAVLQALGVAAHGLGDMGAARGHSEEALALAKALGNKRELAAALTVVAQLDRVEGRPEAAELLNEQAVALARELGDRESIAIGLLNLAMVSAGRERPDRAGDLVAEAIAIAGETGSKPLEQSVMDVCSGLAASRGEWEHAARFYGMAQARVELTGMQRDPADEAFLAPRVAAARQALGAAAFEAAQAAGRESGDGEPLAEARAWISRSG